MTAPVACASCGWTGSRKPGKAVWCPKCGALAAWQIDDSIRPDPVANAG